MQACMDVALPYVQEREQFGHPIGEFQLVQVRDLITAPILCNFDDFPINICVSSDRSAFLTLRMKEYPPICGTEGVQTCQECRFKAFLLSQANLAGMVAALPQSCRR